MTKLNIINQKGITYYSLKNQRKLQNEFKKAGYTIIDLRGEWNGYGFANLGKGIEKSIKTTRFINRFFSKTNEVKETESREAKLKRFIIDEGYDEEDAEEIVQEKISYKQQQLNKMYERQNENPSTERAKLIKQMERKPAIYNVSRSYAKACIEASKRHSAFYESYLEEAREKAFMGEIEKEEVKYYARQKYYAERAKKEEMK